MYLSLELHQKGLSGCEDNTIMLMAILRRTPLVRKPFIVFSEGTRSHVYFTFSLLCGLKQKINKITDVNFCALYVRCICMAFGVCCICVYCLCIGLICLLLKYAVIVSPRLSSRVAFP